MVRALVVGFLAVASGCDVVFRVDRIDPTPRDAPIAGDDTAPNADTIVATPLCTARLIDEMFQSTTPCDGFPLSFANNATLAQGGGRLTIAPTGVGSGGCETNMVPFASGVIVRVTSTVSGSSAFTALNVLGGNNPSITVNSGLLLFQKSDASIEYAQLPYKPTEMAWWRLRPTADRNAIIAEYSADAAAWQFLGIRAEPPSDTVSIEIIAGVATNDAFSGMGVFERLIVCM